ncbi:hypothetical protein HZH68_011637 [Vespula germanica]|uniref:Uncharacterized protein n=1 Tax=Vespula germanica TaxID=30212 RepID=A0A834MZ13_VESGE|nr:hypothetical protein HZH68_011637 [Vespula germanica]
MDLYVLRQYKKNGLELKFLRSNKTTKGILINVGPKQYNVGEMIVIKHTQFALGSKFLLVFLGPYQIKTMLRNNRYIFRKIEEHEGP